MHQADSWDNKVVFDVEHNAAFATHVFDAYFRTPDATGKTYDAFPDFFLIKPQVLDSMRLPLHSQEEQSLLACKTQALARNGYIGVTKYFDEEFAYHWIKFSPYPFKLGDDACENQAEFYALFSRFILYTREHTSIYGDLTTPSDADHDVGSLLRDIGDRAAQLNEKLKRYPESMLLSYDTSWPASEVGKLLSTLASNDEDGHQLFMEYLRHAMRRKAGVGRKWRELQPTADIHTNAKVAALSSGDLQLERTDSKLQADRIEMAKMRCLHLAKLGKETLSKALQAEEEKVRLEALAVFAARKQIADAEAASSAALERLEQIRLARIAEEERVSALEREQLVTERLASAALAKRFELVQAAADQSQNMDVSRLVKRVADESSDTAIDEGKSVSFDELQAGNEQILHSTASVHKGAGGVEHVSGGYQDQGDEYPLITLDFKSIHKPKLGNSTVAVGAPTYDPFAYEEQLSVQSQDVIPPAQLSAESGYQPGGVVTVRKNRGRKRRATMIKMLIAALFLLLGLIGGRFLFHQSQTSTQLVKAQPISYPAETASTYFSVSGVISAEAQNEKAANGEVAVPIPLKMSDHLSM